MQRCEIEIQIPYNKIKISEDYANIAVLTAKASFRETRQQEAMNTNIDLIT